MVFGSLLLRTGIALSGLRVAGGGDLARLPRVFWGSRWRAQSFCACPVRRQPPRPRGPLRDPTAAELAVRLTPDEWIFWQHGFLTLNATIVFTWGLMLAAHHRGRARHAASRRRPERVALAEPARDRRGCDPESRSTKSVWRLPAVIGFLGTLFLFVAAASLCTVIPGYEPPTGSLSTTTALALCVLVAVPIFGMLRAGRRRLPEILRRTDVHHAAVQHHQRGHPNACPGRSAVRQHDERGDDHRHPAGDHAVRLSGPDDLLGLLTGMVQAYIFTILAAVYIAAAAHAAKPPAAEAMAAAPATRAR